RLVIRTPHLASSRLPLEDQPPQGIVPRLEGEDLPLELGRCLLQGRRRVADVLHDPPIRRLGRIDRQAPLPLAEIAVEVEAKVPDEARLVELQVDLPPEVDRLCLRMALAVERILGEAPVFPGRLHVDVGLPLRRIVGPPHLVPPPIPLPKRRVHAVREGPLLARIGFFRWSVRPSMSSARSSTTSPRASITRTGLPKMSSSVRVSYFPASPLSSTCR